MTLQEQVTFFNQNGYLVIPGVIKPEELGPLREESRKLLESPPLAGQERDYQYGKALDGGAPPVRRIEYMLGKGDPFLMLLAHPRVIEIVQAIQGANIVPTWDSMVVKVPFQGSEVPWHRDVPNYHSIPVFNVDFYLDEATPENGCLRVLAGSNNGPDLDLKPLVEQHGYDIPGSIQAPMQPGDVLLHSVMVYHGSPANHSPSLRRVIYYEFRALETLFETNAYPEEWVRSRVHLMQKAVSLRRNAGYLNDERLPEYVAPDGWGGEPEAVQALNPRIPHPGWDD